MNEINLTDLNVKGKDLALNGYMDEALNIFKAICSLDNYHYEANFNLGILYTQKENYQKARIYYLKILEKYPYDKNTTINLIYVLMGLKLFKEALDLLEAYTKHKNCNSNKLNNLRKILINKTSESKCDSLNILFIQNPPCIRNYKYAVALSAKGHKVTLLYGKMPISKRYSGLNDNVYHKIIPLESYSQVWQISKNYDIIHCHNEPDILSVVAMTGKVPVIHDTHDLISLRNREDLSFSLFEGLANRGASGRIYSTKYQRDTAKKLYDINDDDNSLVFGNYASKDDLPSEFLTKLSKKDNQIHLVYQGSISGKKHRCFTDIFLDLARYGFHVHIYPTQYDQKLSLEFKQNPKIHYNSPLSPKLLLKELTQYDAGLIPWNLELGNKQFLDTTIANKLYEYLASGIPVVTSKVKSYEDYFIENKVGITFDNGQDLFSKKDYLLDLCQKKDLWKYTKTYEDEISNVVNFYKKIIKNTK